MAQSHTTTIQIRLFRSHSLCHVFRFGGIIIESRLSVVENFMIEYRNIVMRVGSAVR